jgi:predicted RND superfamily exporter protein
MNIALALVGVFIVIFIATSSFTTTIFIMLCVGLVDLFLFALMVFWDITFNTVTGVNIVVAIGLAVDYSAHIGHAYLETTIPKDIAELSSFEQRIYKSKQALGHMGSSVMHGAISTLLAISALSGSSSFVFLSFFKMVLGIVIFGLINGFVLLPVLLSLCGPLNKQKKVDSDNVKVIDLE